MTDRKTNDPKPALEQYAQMRLEHTLPVSFVWLRTAALLDGSPDREDVAGPVNSALAQLVVDITLICEQQLLHCGNILPAHGELVATALEATTLLAERLGVKSGDQHYQTLVLARGYLEKLLLSTKAFTVKAHEYVQTTPAMAAKYLGDMLAVRDLIVSLNKDHLTIARAEAADLLLIETMVSNAQCAILGFPLARFSDYEQALFFVTNVERLLTALPRSNKVVNTAELAALGTRLAAVRAALTARENQKSRLELTQLRAAVGKLSIFAGRGSL